MTSGDAVAACFADLLVLNFITSEFTEVICYRAESGEVLCCLLLSMGEQFHCPYPLLEQT